MSRRNAPTIVNREDFDATTEAKSLNKAIEGFGTDESAIVYSVASCSNQQRQLIKQEYFNLYKKDLVKEFKSELKICLSFDFKQLLESLFMTPAVHDAHRLKRSVKGLGTDEKSLVEVLLTRTNKQLKAAKKHYIEMFGVPLETDVADDTSGEFRKFVFPLSQAMRDETQHVDREKAKDAAAQIDYTFTKYRGTDTPRFDVIGLCNRENFSQMRATFEEYEKLTSKTITEFVEKEFQKDASFGMRSAIKCSSSITGYLAERLWKSLDRLPRNDDALIRIVVSRSEIDLETIKSEFESRYNKSVETKIEHHTSGLFRRLLLAIVRGNHNLTSHNGDIACQ